MQYIGRDVLPDNLKYCVICNEPADLVCGSCYHVVYCSAKHQEEDWSTHTTACINYSLKRSSVVTYQGPFEVARYTEKVGGNITQGFRVQASVDVPEQQKLFDEIPILIAPWPRTEMRQCEDFTNLPWLQLKCLTCFGCGSALGSPLNTCCGKCNLPICSTQCPGILTHKQNECDVIKKCQFASKKALELNERTTTLLDIRMVFVYCIFT